MAEGAARIGRTLPSYETSTGWDAERDGSAGDELRHLSGSPALGVGENEDVQVGFRKVSHRSASGKLSAVGIYGVASYSVSRRTREMGTRLALGARPGILRRRIFSSAMKVVVVGAAVGLMVALGAGRVMEVLLYGITPRDPLALILAPVVLLAASSLAVWIPVHRYTRVDPAVAMEVE
jgi:hypothetical protein